MLRTRHLLSTVVGALLLVVVAGPAFAGPAPLDEGGATTGSGPGSVPAGSGASIWTYIGYAAAVLLVVVVLTAASMAVTRHAHHHAPHPA